MSRPLLSIIIATKNRITYCINAVDRILKMSDLDFELVVQDNSDSLELKNYVLAHISDKRFIYNYTPPPFSSIDNFNEAFKLANGEYLCLIGDDDGVNPVILDAVRWAKRNYVDSLCPNIYASYIWPNAVSEHPTGYLSLEKFTGKIYKVNPRRQLSKLTKNGFINYLDYSLPKIYHGIIKRSCFEEIKNITGHYFGGLSPDIYSAVALSNIVNRHYMIDYPLTISGVCGASTTVANLQGRHAGQLESAPHFRNRLGYIWDENIPKYYSVHTIWAESALKAIKELNIKKERKYFNLYKLVAISLVYNRNISKIIFTKTSDMLNPASKKIYFYFIVIIYIILEIFKKIVNKVFHLFTKPFLFEISNVKNIEDATNTLVKRLSEEHIQASFSVS